MTATSQPKVMHKNPPPQQQCHGTDADEESRVPFASFRPLARTGEEGCDPIRDIGLGCRATFVACFLHEEEGQRCDCGLDANDPPELHRPWVAV